VASLSQGRTAAAQCGLFTYKSVPVIFEPPCTYNRTSPNKLKVSVAAFFSFTRSVKFMTCSVFFLIKHDEVKKVYYFYYSALRERNGAWFSTPVGKMQRQLVEYTYLPWQSTMKVS